MKQKELYKQFRPKKLSDVLGQQHLIPMIDEWVETDSIPQFLLFTGPSGCGKTTLARILRKLLHCGKHDVHEVNAAKERGIDIVREIETRSGMQPISGKTMVWIIDEAHKLTGDAQGAFLKLLEDTPDGVYFFLCTTNPEKLLRTIRTRSTEISVRSLDDGNVNILLTETARKLDKDIPKAVRDKIIEYSMGSARKAMVFLNQIIHLKSERMMMESVQRSVYEDDAINVARALFRPGIKWKEMSEILAKVVTDEPENIRWLILAYATSILKKGGPMAGRAFTVIQTFRDNWYDCKEAGLVSSCYEIVTGCR